MAALFDTKNHNEKRGSESACFQNAAGFLRVRATGPLQDAATNPLDDTRIHPECYFDETEGISYDFAQKICSDALDRDFDRDDPEGYQDVVIAALGRSYAHGEGLTKAAAERVRRQGVLVAAASRRRVGGLISESGFCFDFVRCVR